MSSRQALEANLRMGSGSDLSSFLVFTSSEEPERHEDPCEKDFSESRFLTQLFGLRDCDFITLHHYYPSF